MQYLAGKTDRKEERTEGEKGPVSDIMSSIFQYEGLRIGSMDNICWFPSYHEREYYFDEEKGEPILDKIFDEDFANYYALKVNNCTGEIETIKKLFGDELVQVLDAELEKATERLKDVRESELARRENDPIEQIKRIVSATRKGEVGDIHSLEQIAEIEAKRQKEKKGKVK